MRYCTCSYLDSGISVSYFLAFCCLGSLGSGFLVSCCCSCLAGLSSCFVAAAAGQVSALTDNAATAIKAITFFFIILLLLNLLVKNFSLLNQMPYICLNLFVFPNGFSYPISWKSSFRYIAAAVPTVPTILLSPA